MASAMGAGSPGLLPSAVRMSVRGLISIAAGSTLLVPAVAQALPGAKLGAGCDEFVRRELATGATLVRSEESPEDHVVQLESLFDGRRMQAQYTCENGSIARQFAVIYLPNEVDAIDLFHRLRDEVESLLGAPFFDGTKPEQLEPFAVIDPDPESVEREYRFYAQWIAKGVQQSVAVSQNRDRWLVTIGSSVTSAARQSDP